MMCAVEYTPQAFIQTDLDLFFQNFSTSQTLKSPKLISVDGGIPQNISRGFNFNGESSLDLQYGMTLTNPQLVQLYQVGDLVEGGSFNNLSAFSCSSYFLCSKKVSSEAWTPLTHRIVPLKAEMIRIKMASIRILVPEALINRNPVAS
jgi:hypothetical protein